MALEKPDNGLTPRLLAMPHWDGSCLGDRKLLHAEQGFGDTLQFVRFGSLIPKAGGKITLAVQAELVSLLTGMSWADVVIPTGRRPPFSPRSRAIGKFTITSGPHWPLSPQHRCLPAPSRPFAPVLHEHI